MKSMAMLAGISLAMMASLAQAQVLGTYRPGVQTANSAISPMAVPTVQALPVQPMPVQQVNYTAALPASNVPAPGTMQVISGGQVYTQPQSLGFASTQVVTQQPVVQPQQIVTQAQYAAAPPAQYIPQPQLAAQPQAIAQPQFVPQAQVVAQPIAFDNCCQPVTMAAPTVAYAPANCCCPTVAQPVVQQVAMQTAVNPTCLPPGGRHYVGRTLWGSPKVYGEGQPIRNAFRFLGP